MMDGQSLFQYNIYLGQYDSLINASKFITYLHYIETGRKNRSEFMLKPIFADDLRGEKKNSVNSPIIRLIIR